MLTIPHPRSSELTKTSSYFAREKWFGTDELGNDQFFPKLYYKLDGITGEWAAVSDNTRC